MKYLPLPMILLALLSCQASFSQSNLQFGASGVFSKTKGFGGEIVGNLQIVKNLSIGLGIKPMKFEEYSNLYVPVFTTIKYYYPLPKWKLFASLDPGHGIYPSEYASDGSYYFKRKGAVYLSGGLGVMGASILAPYASIHFTKFGFTERVGFSSQYRPISTFTFTAGIVLNKLNSKNIFDRKKPFTPLQTREDYENRSKKQKKAARILLGSGAALIVGGIILAYQQNDDGPAAAVPLVFLTGTGIVTSVVSIPFFVAAGINKRNAMNITTSLEMQKRSVKLTSGLLSSSYPALAVRLKF